MDLKVLQYRRRPVLWELLGRLGLPTSSEAHGSARRHDPVPSMVPVFISGFPRTGTTTAMRWLADLLDYNTCFEPLGENAAAIEPERFEAIHALFRAPPADMLAAYERSGGFPGAMEAITRSEERSRLAGLLWGYLDDVHGHFGTNCVVKCIRATWNLTSIASFYESRGITPLFILIESHPLSPVYTFYRLGALTEHPGIPMPSVRSLYAYRRRLCELLGRHEEVCALPCRTAAERLIVACMLEHLEQRRFAGTCPDRAIVTSLGGLHEMQDQILARCGRPCHRPIGPLGGRRRFESDPMFFDRAIAPLSDEIAQAIGEVYGLKVPRTRPAARISLRQRITAWRHDHYDADTRPATAREAG